MTLRCRLLPVGRRRPFVADERGETTRLVVFFRCGGDALPRRARHRHPLERILASDHRRTPSVVRLAALAGLDQVVHLAAELGLEQIRVRFGDHGREAEVFGVVRDDEEVERPTEPRGQAGAGFHRLAARKAIRLLRPESVADHAGIGRITGVQVRIAEEHPVREVLLRIGRILDFLVGRRRRVLGERSGTQCERGKGRDNHAERVETTSLVDMFALLTASEFFGPLIN